MQFNARLDAQLGGLILMDHEGKRFGFLVRGRFFSENADLETFVNAEIKPKYSRGTLLQICKRRYLEWLGAQNTAKPKRRTKLQEKLAARKAAEEAAAASVH